MKGIGGNFRTLSFDDDSFTDVFLCKKRWCNEVVPFLFEKRVTLRQGRKRKTGDFTTSHETLIDER